MRLALAIACAISRSGVASCSHPTATSSRPVKSPTARAAAVVARWGGGAVDEAGATEAGDDGSPGCKLARPLNRKIKDEVPGKNELVFVTHNMDVGETTDTDGIPRYLKLGYDLNDTCGAERKCKNPLDMNPEGRAGINGIDDALGRMIASIKMTFGTEIVSSALVNQETADAQLPPMAMFRIRNYGGQQDDNQVDVDWFHPVLANADSDGGQVADAGPPAKWDGTDVWPVEPSAFEPIFGRREDSR